MTTKFSFYQKWIDRDFDTRYKRQQWAESTFGKPGVKYSWFRRTYVIPTKYGINDINEVFYFKREKDATLFSLRWS